MNIELPQPDIWVREDFGYGDFTTHVGYTEEQLKAYGEACWKAATEAERARCAELCEKNIEGTTAGGSFANGMRSMAKHLASVLRKQAQQGA